MKLCGNCGLLKDDSSFHRRRMRSGRTILQPRCKTCSVAGTRAWRAENPRRVEEIRNKWRAANLERCREHCRKHYRRNRAYFVEREKTLKRKTQKKEQASRYAEKYPERIVARAQKRNAAELQALPTWANQFFIEEIYDLAKLRTKHLGIKHHVDHIVPLRHPLVCGLHVEHNLRVIPAVDNLKKRNLWWPDMPSNERS